MEKYGETDLIAAVRRHAINNYEQDGWDVLVECWDDGDILERISDANAQTPDAAIKACLSWVALYDERRREIRNA
ncbi:MAG: hypothetical protein ACPHEP_01850 [Acidimicrobiales bacterium]